jgi:hypothetical protein
MSVFTEPQAMRLLDVQRMIRNGQGTIEERTSVSRVQTFTKEDQRSRRYYFCGEEL